MDNAHARRASQFCRILGNPLAYSIVRLLDGTKRRPMDLARILGVSASSVVTQLRFLKIAGIVRFRSTGFRRAGRKVEYWLSDRHLARLIEDLEQCLRGLRG
jgi:DNA-binding transcriptional ArsR family regulator